MDHPSGWTRQGGTRTHYLRSSPPLPFHGDHRDRAELSRITCDMLEARRAFKAAAFAGDLGGALKAERDYETGAAELREMMLVVVLKPDGQVFGEHDAEDAVVRVRRFIDHEIEEEREKDE